MPSDIVVTGPESLRRNFAANAQELFCNTVFQGGALASGLGVLWLTPFAAAGAVTTAAGLIAMAHCPNGFDEEILFGGPPPFTGGQCFTLYTIKIGYTFVPFNEPRVQNLLNYTGPIIGIMRGDPPEGVGPGIYIISTQPGDPNERQYTRIWSQLNTWADERIIDVTRQDGQPDDCGNPEGSPPGTYINNSIEGDTIDQSKVINNNDYKLVVPINFNIGQVVGVMNLPFSNVEMQNYVPIRFSADVGGVRLYFEIGDEGTTLIEGDRATENDALDKLYREIEEVKGCVCSPEVELDMLNLPLIQEVDDQCNDIAINLMAARGTYPVNIEQQFEQSRVLAEKGCSEPPPNEPRTIILSGEATGTQQIFTSEELSPDIRVIEFEVTQFGPDTRLFIGGNNNESQGRFGVVSPGYFDTTGEFYAMPGLAQYYERSLVLIPNEIISALGVRVSVSVGTKFNIWDTGLRFTST